MLDNLWPMWGPVVTLIMLPMVGCGAGSASFTSNTRDSCELASQVTFVSEKMIRPSAWQHLCDSLIRAGNVSFMYNRPKSKHWQSVNVAVLSCSLLTPHWPVQQQIVFSVSEAAYSSVSFRSPANWNLNRIKLIKFMLFCCGWLPLGSEMPSQFTVCSLKALCQRMSRLALVVSDCLSQLFLHLSPHFANHCEKSLKTTLKK